MKWFWKASAIGLCGLGVLAGCNDYNNTVQYNTGATITNISPSALPAGTPTPGTVPNCPNSPASANNPCFTLFIVGTSTNGFQSTTLVEWNQKKLPVCTNTGATNGCSTYVDATDMTAYVPYSLVANPGTAYVNTWTPQSGTGNNGLSNALTFIIYGAANPYPQLSSVSPTSAAYCDPSSKCSNVSITLTGSNFIPVSQNGGSSVTYTGLATYGAETAITVNSISSTQLKATIPGTYLCATDTAKINVINPPSAVCIVNCPNLGGGDTNDPPNGQPVTTQTFTVTNSAPINSCPAQSPPTNPLVREETPAVSQDGRYVAYTSEQNELSQILLRDTCVGATKECTASTQTVSVSTEGVLGNADSHTAAMTPDGRYVAFSSAATNLVVNAPTGRQVYLRDTCTGAATGCKPETSLVSTDPEGKLNGTEAILPSISTSGRFVAFLAVTPSQSSATTNSLKGSVATGVTGATGATGATNSGLRQVFVRDTCLGATNCTPTTTRISLAPGDTAAGSSKPAGPALAGLAKQLALPDGKSATVFTPTVPIDDQVFLAIRNEKQ
jgi:WD40-like Beta Propeller Repeat